MNRADMHRLRYSFVFLIISVLSVTGVFSTQVHSAEVTLAWDANTESDLKGYVVYYKTGASGPPYNGAGLDQGDSGIVVLKENLDNPNQPTFQLSGLVQDVEYCFAVTAIDILDNESGYSNEVAHTSASIDMISLPSSEAYGNIKGGDNTHINQISYTFDGFSGDVTLYFEVWDADYSTDEIQILINGTEIAFAPVTQNEMWGGIVAITLPDSLVNDTSSNSVTFNNTYNPPQQYYWGVRNVSVEPSFDVISLPSFEAYGNIKGGGDNTHIDQVSYSFDGFSGDVTLYFEIWDADFSDEIQILINGTEIAFAPVTQNEMWGGIMAVTLPGALVNDTSGNSVTFNNTYNPPQQYYWGVRNVSVEPSFDVISLPSFEAYGNIKGGGDNTHIDQVNYSFDGFSGDVTLYFEIWDADFSDEIQILINGTEIAFAPVTQNEMWGGIMAVTLPDSLVNDTSSNSVTFNNTYNPPQQFYWGVRNVSIDMIPLPSSEAYGNIKGGGDNTHIDQVSYTFDGFSGDVTLYFEIWDADFSDEIQILINGTEFAFAPVTQNETWGGIMAITLPDSLVNDTPSNSVTFNNTYNPPQQFYWGVRNVSVGDIIP